MRCRYPMTAFLLLAGLVIAPGCSQVQNPTSSPAPKVLERKVGGFNVLSVRAILKKGDKASSIGDLDEARRLYDKARTASKQLLSFYGDLGGAFRGINTQIPREMDLKRREAVKLLADVNLRLAALFRRLNEPEIAVPLLVEVVRLMTPAKPEGQKAYQRLLELGFVSTPFTSGQ